MTHERGKIEHQKGKKMGTSWQCQTSIRLCKTKLDFEVMHPCIQARWLEAADLFSSNLWHTAAFVRLAKWEQLISSALFFLATDLRLQSAVPSLIVTSWAPFRVCLKANIGLLIGYFNALNYGEKEEKRKKKIPGTYISAKVSESGRIWSRNKSPLNLSPSLLPQAWLPLPFLPPLLPPPAEQ